jgi:monofunctional biosynthetic peptidoglycan transglycosylase
MNNLSYSKWLLKGVSYALLSAFIATLILVIAYKWVNPSTTWLMAQRYYVHPKTKLVTPKRNWVSIDNISPNMINAVIASEDNLFMEHYGFDFESIKKARQGLKKGGKLKGASTISMQTAKNVFLWPKRTWTRKAFETMFTVFIEVFWSKERIMEVYLNIIELGPAVYGTEAASQLYFKNPAVKLTKSNAAMLAAVLPNPIQRNAAKPTAFLKSNQQRILRIMSRIDPVSFTKTEPQKKETKKTRKY